jgi:hypothetical protein
MTRKKTGKWRVDQKNGRAEIPVDPSAGGDELGPGQSNTEA